MSWGRVHTILVMWEYSCDYSPLWSRGDAIDVGPVDASSIGVSDSLREDLAEWNRAMAVAADPGEVLRPEERPDQAWWLARRVASFALAARVQRELGDGWTVWCLGGGRDGDMREPGAIASRRRQGGRDVLLRTSGLVEWRPDRETSLVSTLRDPLRRTLRSWLASADRLAPAGSDGPGTNARGEYLAQGLELAGQIAGALPADRLYWFGGGDVPARIARVGRASRRLPGSPDRARA